MAQSTTTRRTYLERLGNHDLAQRLRAATDPDDLAYLLRFVPDSPARLHAIDCLEELHAAVGQANAARDALARHLET